MNLPQPDSGTDSNINSPYWGDNFSPRMPFQWYVRGGGEVKRWIVIGQSVPPTPFGMAFGRLKLSPLYSTYRYMPSSAHISKHIHFGIFLIILFEVSLKNIKMKRKRTACCKILREKKIMVWVEGFRMPRGLAQRPELQFHVRTEAFGTYESPRPRLLHTCLSHTKLQWMDRAGRGGLGGCCRYSSLWQLLKKPTNERLQYR
jgi:hypothetical protein